MANLKIFFFLLGDSSPSNDTFTIVASPCLSVAEVKDEVYAKKQNGLRGIDASDLRLWKLNNPIPAERVDASEVLALGENLDLEPSAVAVKMSAVAVEMVPATEMSDHFPAAPTPQSLHVIVQPPRLLSARKRGYRRE